MGLEQFDRQINSTDELAALIGQPSELVIRKQLPALDSHMQEFLATSPFVLLGTLGADGRLDVSPRGDFPAVARVLDPGTLVIPERKGNRRIDSLRNIVETGQVGLLFITPGTGETLRVNGRACVLQDEDVLASLEAGGVQPVAGIGVEVEECYFQCAKAVIRSRLWQDAGAQAQAGARKFAEILAEQTGLEQQSVDELQERIADSYRNMLY
ncbi:MAG: pyridoxamine 5'-phosphate oxidase family protein [Planctomycetaceae bacterium]|nr:pyridoxamine 5'-phosphate oxidase family protein [Planctomycetaceae bacterium]